ncbi:hypothetical protein OG948_21200 [Embleya sp. NBC_00888]|uniref:hypothetical protein n=1 Tax=Embleya sp. NBC_00888 TaxID=2975960 RepID=UPI003868F784|nr:hypothetical protein OG948_21200 [Embleya sp. NBC_00888]
MNWLQVVATSATAATGITGFAWRYVVLPIRRIAQRQEEFRQDWDGMPARPGVPERQGVMPRLARIEERQAATEERTARIEHELRPNSGTSLRDAVDRVEQAVTPDQPT